MTIVRRRHPFEGRTLEVHDRQHRRGELLLTLVLPDGTRSLIPAAWTDLHGLSDSERETLASAEQLLRARIVVDALLRRVEASKDEVRQPEEDERAQVNEQGSRNEQRSRDESAEPAPLIGRREDKGRGSTPRRLPDSDKSVGERGLSPQRGPVGRRRGEEQ